MSENITTASEETIEIGSFFAETMSPYGMSVAVNKILAAIGIDKTLPGPMFYTYTKKGYITSIEGSNNKKVSKEAAIEWTEKYIAKLITKATKVENEVVVEEKYIGFENE